MKKLVMRHRATIIQFMQFGMVGFAGFFFDLSLIWFGIHALGLGKIGAGLFSFPFSVTFTWIGNRLFTFRHAPRESAARQWAKFTSVCAVGLTFNRGAYSLLVATVPFINHYYFLALLAGTGAGMFFNFFVSKKLVFR